MTETEDIVIFGAETCAPCKQVKMYLDRKGLPYTYKDVDNDPEALREMLYYSDNRVTKPVVKTSKGVMVGFSMPRLVELL
jgi:glutaredoxin